MGLKTKRYNMVDHNNFHENLERINEGELEVANLLNDTFVDLNVSFILNDDKLYDIKGYNNNKEVTFEVKEDFRCADTGNVVVEYESRGKPSGIETTGADFWIFRLHMNDDIGHYIVGTNRLKRIIKEKKYSRKYHMPHTDSKNRVYFFRYDYLISVCYKIDK